MREIKPRIVEAGGWQHDDRAVYDLLRIGDPEAKGCSVPRFRNHAILNNLESRVERIEAVEDQVVSRR